VLEYEKPTPAGESRKSIFATAEDKRTLKHVVGKDKKSKQKTLSEEGVSLTLVPSIRIGVKCFPIRVDSKRANFFSCSISNRGASRATIKPQN